MKVLPRNLVAILLLTVERFSLDTCDIPSSPPLVRHRSSTPRGIWGVPGGVSAVEHQQHDLVPCSVIKNSTADVRPSVRTYEIQTYVSGKVRTDVEGPPVEITAGCDEPNQGQLRTGRCFNGRSAEHAPPRLSGVAGF